MRIRRIKAMIVTTLGCVTLVARLADLSAQAPGGEGNAARPIPDVHPLYRDTKTWPVSVEFAGTVYPVTQGATVGYVPDSACVPCHEGISTTYAEVGMSKAFYRPTAENIIENYESNHFFHQASDTHYEMVQRGGEFFQKQYRVDGNGKQFGESEQRIAWIMGSGGHVRTYLYQTPSGELFQLPLAWYSQGKHWGMNPGYDNPNHQGVTRRIERECMFCHNAYPDITAGSDALMEPPLFPTSLPQGIGCQRCHGPGGEHVRIAAAPVASLQELRQSIVNPATLSPRLRDDVCMQCHMQPLLSPTSFVRKFGRGEFSYRAGEPLDDYLLFVDYDEPAGSTERFEINHHPYRLFQSACYNKSDRRMSCLTCHDPHQKVKEADRAAYYRTRCLTCHVEEKCSHCREAASANAGRPEAMPQDCVGCHMPQRRAQDVVEVSMTDHKIVRRASLATLMAPLTEGHRTVLFPPRPYWPNRAPDPPDLALYLDSFAALRGDASRMVALQSELKRIKPPMLDPYFYLAELQTERKEHRGAVETFREILQRSPDRSAALRGLGHALASSGSLERGVSELAAAVRTVPNASHHHFLLGSVLVASGRTDKGIQELEEAVRLRPTHVSALADLGDTLASVGRIEEGAKYFEKALAMAPSNSRDYMRLAEYQLYLRRPEEAARWLNSAVRIHESDGPLRLSLACALVQVGQYDKAEGLAMISKDGGGDEAICRLVFSAVRAGRRDVDGARSEFQKAQALAAANPIQSPLRRIMMDYVASRLAAMP